MDCVIRFGVHIWREEVVIILSLTRQFYIVLYTYFYGLKFTHSIQLMYFILGFSCICCDGYVWTCLEAILCLKIYKQTSNEIEIFSQSIRQLLLTLNTYFYGSKLGNIKANYSIAKRQVYTLYRQHTFVWIEWNFNSKWFVVTASFWANTKAILGFL